MLLWEQWVGDCFDTSVDESLEDFKGDTQQRYRTIALRVRQWFLWLRDCNYYCSSSRRSQGEPKGPCTPKFLENIVILCFDRRFLKQNSVIRLKSYTFALPIFCPPNFWAGYATVLLQVFEILS